MAISFVAATVSHSAVYIVVLIYTVELAVLICACGTGSYSATDDRLYTHEAAGLLAGGEDNTEEQQLAYLSTLMQPLLAQIEQNLPLVGAATQGLATQNGRPPPDPVGMVLQVSPPTTPSFPSCFPIPSVVQCGEL